jgi:hypothetical protein
MKTLKDVDKLYTEACHIALALIEKKARKIMREHLNIQEFVMAMGGWNFWYYDGNQVPSDLKYLEPVRKIFDEWDDYLKLTGTPMRFTAEGLIRTDW